MRLDHAGVSLVRFKGEVHIERNLDTAGPWRVNWEPKSANLRAMADELGLGLDSFVLVDDSPFELAEVAANAPEVATIRFPEDPADCRSATARGTSSPARTSGCR